jgi:high affinity Mn2+ porin
LLNHRDYLKLGGLGFDLGDGASATDLRKSRRPITISQLGSCGGYTERSTLRYINNLGYNRDRGPVLAPSCGSIDDAAHRGLESLPYGRSSGAA